MPVSNHRASTTVGTASDTARPSPVLIGRVFLISLGIGYNFALIGPIAKELSRSFDVTLGAVGLLTTLLLITHALSQLPAAIPAQRIGPLKMVRIVFVFVAIANAIAVVAPWFWLLGATRLMVGCFTGPVFVGGLDGTRRLGGPFLAGVFGGAATFGVGLSLVVGGLFDSLGMSWRATFVVAAVLAALAAAFGPSDAAKPSGEGAVAHIGAVLRSGPLWRLALLHSATFGASLVVGAWIVTHLVNGEASTFVAGAIGFGLLGTAAVFRPVGGELFGRGTSWRVLGPFATLGAGVGLFLLALGPPTWLAAIVSLAIGVCFALPFSAVFALSVRAEPANPAAAIALVNMMGAVFALALTPFTGVMMDHDAGYVGFLALAAVAVLAAWVARNPLGVTRSP